MKTYNEIKKEIQKLSASMCDTAKTQKQLDGFILRDAVSSKDPDKIEEARKVYKEAETRYQKELERNEIIKLKIEILKDNAAQAFKAENIGIICDIWNKYEGKPHGEKTAQKIKDEIKDATGCYVSIGNRYNDANITIYFSLKDRAPFNSLELVPNWNGGENFPALIDNKIAKLDANIFRVYCGSEYIENIDKHVKAIKKAHQAAKKAEEAFGEAVSAYNKLTRGSIQKASTREGVKNWLI